MPHQSNWNTWGDSSTAVFELVQPGPCEGTISDFFNMSYAKHFADFYSGQTGGVYGEVNRANIAGVRILRYSTH